MRFQALMKNIDPHPKGPGLTGTHLVMVHPPRTGNDFGIPGRAVAHSHGACLRQGPWRDRLPCKAKGKYCIPLADVSTSYSWINLHVPSANSVRESQRVYLLRTPRTHYSDMLI